ncbi:MAG: hypothetical protein A3H98_02210 [Bacteroidetes bacterium RIFCSPLOWO2_02_FULL_36_8]|nr:MAG: hypothetical protein A3H98_02210 [Bacteroidetes bacterium RIFCSPLOWO2_02_FULL_36_8]OFY69195.1 MAG: hypothetical protein A3G23_06510 [Bacteroidetes bacterium RIFCSPLOWO2_12_FULL_37_12]
MNIKSYRLPLFTLFFFLVIAGFSYINESETTGNKGTLVSFETAPFFSAKNDSLQATIISSALLNEGPKDVYAGKIFLKKGTKVAEHTHSCTEILCVETGAGKLMVADTIYQMQKGTAVIIPAGAPHSFFAEEDFSSVQIYGESGQEQKYLNWKRVR